MPNPSGFDPSKRLKPMKNLQVDATNFPEGLLSATIREGQAPLALQSPVPLPLPWCLRLHISSYDMVLHFVIYP